MVKLDFLKAKKLKAFSFIEISFILFLLILMSTFVFFKIQEVDRIKNYQLTKTKMSNLMYKIREDYYARGHKGRIDYSIILEDLEGETKETVLDAWNTPFKISVANGRMINLTSYGSDKKKNSMDDIRIVYEVHTGRMYFRD